MRCTRQTGFAVTDQGIAAQRGHQISEVAASMRCSPSLAGVQGVDHLLGDVDPRLANTTSCRIRSYFSARRSA
jgi:hypothetical protein